MANNRLVMILVLVIVILAGVLVFSFLIKPSYDNFIVEKRTEGYQIAINDILLSLQQNNFVQLPVGNQTIFLAPVNPQQ